MRCMFCNKSIFNKETGPPVTLSGRGVAHSQCAEQDLMKRRVFHNISMKDLADQDLQELYELASLEMNERNLRKNT